MSRDAIVAVLVVLFVALGWIAEIVQAEQTVVVVKTTGKTWRM